MDFFSNIDPDSGFNFARGLAIVAGFLTLIALGSLWYFGNKKDNQTSISIAESQTEAAKANAEAEKAKNEAAKANKNTKKIELDLEKARNAAISQEEKVESLKLKVEQEAKNRAKAEIDLINLQQKVSWRNLDENIFIKTLNQFSTNSKNVEIIFNPADPENEFFSNKIYHALIKAGCTVETPKGVRSSNAWSFLMEHGGGATSDEDFRGLNILYADFEESPNSSKESFLYSINQAFKKCGFSPFFLGGHEGIRPQKGTIKIVIDSRL